MLETFDEQRSDLIGGDDISDSSRARIDNLFAKPPVRMPADEGLAFADQVSHASLSGQIDIFHASSVPLTSLHLSEAAPINVLCQDPTRV